MQFVYGGPAYKKPFFVRSIWHDGRFTYIQTDARELPALYEIKDGQDGSRAAFWRRLGAAPRTPASRAASKDHAR